MNLKERFKHWSVHTMIKAHEPAHLLYFAAVGIEAHGMYSVAAIVCLFIGAFLMLVHGGG